MQIGLRQVAGVACLGEQAKIRKLQLNDEFSSLHTGLLALLAQPGGITQCVYKSTHRTEYGREDKIARAGNRHEEYEGFVWSDYAVIPEAN